MLLRGGSPATSLRARIRLRERAAASATPRGPPDNGATFPAPVPFSHLGAGRRIGQHRPRHTRNRGNHPLREVPRLEAQHKRFLLGIREQQDVDSGRLGVEEDARSPGQPYPLDERSLFVPDQQDKRPPRSGVLELDIDLTGRSLELDFDTHGGDWLEHEEARETGQSDRHARGIAPALKALALERRDAPRG